MMWQQIAVHSLMPCADCGTYLHQHETAYALEGNETRGNVLCPRCLHLRHYGRPSGGMIAEQEAAVWQQRP